MERTFEAPTYASTASADYMPLHPSTRSWEISRRQVNIVKVIGKGAFSQVAKATVNDMRGSQDNLTVAVKMLKGVVLFSVLYLINGDLGKVESKGMSIHYT